MTTDHQILLTVNLLLDTRRALFSRGFIDRTAEYRKTLSSDLLFALQYQNAFGRVALVATNSAADLHPGEYGMNLQVHRCKAAGQLEVEAFVSPKITECVADALRSVQDYLVDSLFTTLSPGLIDGVGAMAA